MKYTAFGEIRDINGSPTDYESKRRFDFKAIPCGNRSYTGQRKEVEFGLSYYNARWYDASLAHFTSADTLIPQPGDSGAWDRYAYVLNNPLKYIDPSGHYSLLPNNPIPQIEGDDDITRNANSAAQQEANRRVKMGSKNALVRANITFTHNPVPEDFSLPTMAGDPVVSNGGYPYWAFGSLNYPYRDAVGMDLWNRQHGGHSGIDIAADDGTAIIWPFHEIGYYYVANIGSMETTIQFYIGDYGYGGYRLAAVFRHVDKLSFSEPAGDTVQFGDVIGTVQGDHLHFELRLQGQFCYISPCNTFNADQANYWLPKYVVDYQPPNYSADISDQLYEGSYGGCPWP